MNNLTIKKVALGLLLAGYAASGAFALTTTTSTTIKGHAPLLTNAAGDAVVAGQPATGIVTQMVDVLAYKNDGTTPLPSASAISVGNYIEVQYKLQDADGDTEDADNKETAKTVVFYFSKDNGTSWTSGGTLPAANVKKGFIKWKVPKEALGANRIGFKIQANTTYGDPKKGDWLVIDDISANTKPVITDTDPASNLPAGPDGPGGKKTTGPTTTKPVEAGETYGVKILYVSTSGTAVADRVGDYQVANGPIGAGSRTTVSSSNPTILNPMITDKFEAQAWHIEPAVTSPPTPQVDTNVTSQFTQFDWYVTGGNSAAGGSVAAGVDDVYFVQLGTDKYYTLPVNGSATFTAASAAQNKAIQGNNTAGAATAFSATQPEAGLQGFKLGVYIHNL